MELIERPGPYASFIDTIVLKKLSGSGKTIIIGPCEECIRTKKSCDVHQFFKMLRITYSALIGNGSGTDSLALEDDFIKLEKDVIDFFDGYLPPYKMPPPARQIYSHAEQTQGRKQALEIQRLTPGAEKLGDLFDLCMLACRLGMRTGTARRKNISSLTWRSVTRPPPTESVENTGNGAKADLYYPRRLLDTKITIQLPVKCSRQGHERNFPTPLRAEQIWFTSSD